MSVTVSDRIAEYTRLIQLGKQTGVTESAIHQWNVGHLAALKAFAEGRYVLEDVDVSVSFTLAGGDPAVSSTNQTDLPPLLQAKVDELADQWMTQ